MEDLPPRILSRRMHGVQSIHVWTYSDASYNIVSGRIYGQTGIITGLMLTNDEGDTTFHTVDWGSSKQKRVSHSSYGAEILPCSEADDRGFYLNQAGVSIAWNRIIEHVLHVDSCARFDTISTLHDGKEYRLR